MNAGEVLDVGSRIAPSAYYLKGGVLHLISIRFSDQKDSNSNQKRVILIQLYYR
jgi:hypothetical protein